MPDLQKTIQQSDVNKAFGIVEDVLDTLIEVGNGTTDDDLHDAADKLFGLRYFLTSVFQPDQIMEQDRECWDELKLR